jgi:hypothetical protein
VAPRKSTRQASRRNPPLHYNHLFPGRDRLKAVTPPQRSGKEFGQITALLKTLDRREDQFDRPFRGDTLRLQWIGQTEPADDQIGATRKATRELSLQILTLAEQRRASGQSSTRETGSPLERGSTRKGGSA